MAKYDLTNVISEHLDRHLVVPLIEFLVHKQLYKRADILKAQYDIVSKTKMVDIIIESWTEIHQSSEPPAELLQMREQVIAELQAVQEDREAIDLITEHAETLRESHQDKLHNIKFLQEQFGFNPDSLESVFKYARILYDCSYYETSGSYLYHYSLLATNPEKLFAASWGKLACFILTQDWENALGELTHLKETIDKETLETRTSSTPLEQLQQRTWFVHWGLFVFFNHPKGREVLIDLFFQPHFLNTIQTTCPHILRYLTTAVVCNNKKRRNVLKDLVKIIQQESHTYRDPITELLECLYVNFDFDGAQNKLRECEEVLMNDFFLVACRDEFIENARLLIFETYCSIHQSIDIRMLAQRLNMSDEEAERWIVNLIRNARLDAKIDSKEGHVIMGTPTQSVYQQVIEKTKGISYRSMLIANNLEKRAQYVNPDAGFADFE
eukprot:Colp12_sorted_trinity150504_noHs@27278